MPNHKVKSWWRYIPSLHKPISLEPLRPWHWFYYYGPDPAAGVSYGQYEDPANEVSIITENAEKVYSPVSGEPMSLVEEVPFEEIERLFSKVEGDKSNSSVRCNSCQANLVSDYDLSSLEDLHCVTCGNQVETLEKEGQVMAKVDSRQAKVEALKKRIVAKIAARKKEGGGSLKEEIRKKVQAKKDSEKVQAKKDSEKVLSEEKRTELREKFKQKVMAERKQRLIKEAKERAIARIKAQKEAKADEDELIPLERIMEAMDDMDDMGDAEDGGEAECETGDAYMEEEVAEEEVAEEEVAEEEVAEEVAAEEEAAEEAEVPAEENEEDYLDLDMVISLLRNKDRLTNARARARSKAVEKRRAQAEDAEEEEEVAAAEEEETEKAPAKEAPAEEAPAEEAAEETYEDQVAMEAMRFEPLASAEAMNRAKKEDIEMVLYDEDGENPTWQVTVAGVPAARIQLKEQVSPDEIRRVFCSEDYAADLVSHCGKIGFVDTLKKVNANFWGNQVSNSKIADHFKLKFESQYGDEKKKLLASFREEFVNCLNIATAGMNKNFYPKIGNPLKDQLFTNLTTLGLPEQSAIAAIEKSFSEGASEYFNSLFEKVTEYMELSKEARAEIAQAIASSNSLDHSGSMETVQPATLADRVSNASAVASLTPGFQITESGNNKMDANDFKSQLKSTWVRKR